MLDDPVRHFLYQRIQQVAELGSIPESLRPTQFLERLLRPAYREALFLADVNWEDEAMSAKTLANRKRIGRIEATLGKMLTDKSTRTFSDIPRTRAMRNL